MMRIEQVLGSFRWMLTRMGFWYLLVCIAVLGFVDVRTVADRVKIRRMNDARPDMSVIVSFTKGEISPEKMIWAPYQRYFSMVIKYMPAEKVSAMFLGVIEHYMGDPHRRSWEYIRDSAETYPFIFWNVYNAGVLAFERGDMEMAIVQLERTRLFSSDKVEVAIRSSVVYRQVMAMHNFDLNVQERINVARQNAQLLLAAAYFYTGAFEKAKTAALLLAEKVAPKDKEPFYFYAGAADIKLGRIEEAMSLFGRCVELGSRNPEVYRYAGEVLKRTGSQDAGENMLRTGKALQQRTTGAFPYPERLRLQFI